VSVPGVVRTIVARGLCSGCGVCVAVCPEASLRMEFNRAGELVAAGGDCRSGCGRCLSVCPGADRPGREPLSLATDAGPGLARTALAGRALPGEFAGSRSSGGLASAFLAGLLETGAVERVLAVTGTAAGPDPDGRLFRFAVMDRAEQVRGAARSCYYPVELSGVLAEVRRTRGRTAVIGLPCAVRAVRNLQALDPVMAGRITVLAGLVCGGTRSRHWAGYLCLVGGGNPAELAEAEFRDREPGQPAREYGFRFRCRDGLPGRVGAAARNAAWARRWFQPEACDCCDDVLADLADVAFMDAGPGRDDQGMVLVRSGQARELFDRLAAAGRVEVEAIADAEVLAAQRGLLRWKQEGLAERLALRTDPPGRRVAPARIARLRRIELGLQLRERRQVVEAFIDCALRRTPARAEAKALRFRLRTLAVRVLHRVVRVAARLERGPGKAGKKAGSRIGPQGQSPHLKPEEA